MQQLSSVLLGAPVSTQNPGQEVRGEEGFADLLSRAQNQLQGNGSDKLADKPAERSVAGTSAEGESHQQPGSTANTNESSVAASSGVTVPGKGESKATDEADLASEQTSELDTEPKSSALAEDEEPADSVNMLPSVISLDTTNEPDNLALGLLFSQIQLARQWADKGDGADLPPEGEIFAAFDSQGNAFSTVNMWFSAGGPVSSEDTGDSSPALNDDLASLLAQLKDMPDAGKLTGMLEQFGDTKMPLADIQALLSQLTNADGQPDLQKSAELLGIGALPLSDEQQKALGNLVGQLTALVQLARLEGQVAGASPVSEAPGLTTSLEVARLDSAAQPTMPAVAVSGSQPTTDVPRILSAGSNQALQQSALPEGIVALTAETDAQSEQVSLSQAAKMLQQAELTVQSSTDVIDERVTQLTHNQSVQTPIHRSEVPQFQLSVRQEVDGQFQQQQLIQKFAPLMQQQLVHMVSKGIGQAEIRLDPPELGQMLVRIQVNGDQTQVQFHAMQQQTRDMLEQTLPRLREMLQSQGMELADGQVSQQQSSGGGQTDGEGSGHHGVGREVDEIAADAPASVTNQRRSGGSAIDYYA
ncbi:flagellar hook-length control protein FliK [Shewanella sp. GXUN23E]|uniref:flagellar hook-length control protein FliK n=1 Tax=Shewanella sp. GXUN23E TaxID=3422498 RepID=UPI003D7D8B0E